MTKISLYLRNCLLHAVLNNSYLILFLIFKILLLRFVFSFCRTEYIWEIPTIQRLLAWLWNSPFCLLCRISRDERRQGERYAWFNASISHRNSLTLPFSLLMAIWTEKKKQKPESQVALQPLPCFLWVWKGL